MSSSDPPLLNVENCSKKFCRTLKRSLLYGLYDSARECIGLAKRTPLRRQEFWAIQDMSFQLRPGECLGVIGPNGAGKSTLLKLISGLVKPDAGRIVRRGTIGALIELSAGLNPILTGLENIYILGAVRGLTRKEIDRKLDEIVEFSELGDFLKMPVKSYSSGMRVRLGFSVAAQFQPDLLVIDEVLAVGDANFRIKCLNRTRELMDSAGVIFVSHNMSHVDNLATRLMIMNKGHALMFDRVDEGIDHYLNEVTSVPTGRRFCTELGEIHSARMTAPAVPADADADALPTLSTGESMELVVDYSLAGDVDEHDVVLQFRDAFGHTVGVAGSQVDGVPMSRLGDRQQVRIQIPMVGLAPGKHVITVSIWSAKPPKVVSKLENCCPHMVTGPRIGGRASRFAAQWQASPSSEEVG